MPLVCIPSTGIIFSSIGLAMALAAITMSRRHGYGIGLGIAGATLCAVPLVLQMRALKPDFFKAVNLRIVGDSTTQNGSKANAATGSFIIGPIELEIVSTTVGGLPILEDVRMASHQDKVLKIGLRLTNISTDRKIEYKSPFRSRFTVSNVTLKDDKGNVYKDLWIDGGAEGQITTATSLYPKKVCFDKWVFEPPVDEASELILTFRGDILDADGAYSFRIPRSMWSK